MISSKTQNKTQNTMQSLEQVVKATEQAKATQQAEREARAARLALWRKQRAERLANAAQRRLDNAVEKYEKIVANGITRRANKGKNSFRVDLGAKGKFSRKVANELVASFSEFNPELKVKATRHYDYYWGGYSHTSYNRQVRFSW